MEYTIKNMIIINRPKQEIETQSRIAKRTRETREGIEMDSDVFTHN